MANDTPDVTMRAPSGKQFTVPRGNLAKAKALGWIEVQAAAGAEPEVKKQSLFDVFSVETARGMGLDPEKIERMGGKSLGKGALEVGREIGKGTGDWMTATAKDPFRVLDPAHAAASGIEKGLSGVWKTLTETDRHDPKLLEKLVGAGGGLTGSLAGAAAIGEAPEGVKAVGAIPGKVAEGAKAVAEGPRSSLKYMAKASEEQIKKLQSDIAKENAAKTGEFKSQSQQARAAARGEYEAAEAKKTAETEAVSKKHQRAINERQNIERQNAYIETAKKTLNQIAQDSTKRVTQNLQSTLDTAKTAFDAEYGDFEAKVLGKSAQNPKGTAQSDLSAFANAVEKAKKSDIQGSEESIKQFTQIMSRLGEDKLDTGEGLGVPPGKTIPTVDLRGFVTELENIAYNRNILPDVKTAIKNVAEAGKNEVLKTVGKVGGGSAVNALKDLNSRYADYLTDWKDTSSTNPLPKVRNLLLEGVVRQNPSYPVHLDIGRILKGNNATKALELLNKYKKFGADPNILKGYQDALERLDTLPKPKKIPEIKTPKYPAPVTEAKLSLPKEPELKGFNRKEFVGEKLSNLGQSFFKYSAFFPMLQLIHDLAKGEIPGPELLTAPGVGVAIQKLLNNPKVVEWAAKEKP